MEQIDKKIVKSQMEQYRPREHGPAEVLRCHPGKPTELQTTYAQYKVAGGHTQQSSMEVGKLVVGHKCKHYQKHSAGFMLKTKTHSCSANLTKRLARGHISQWTTWRCLNRLLTGVMCSKEQGKKLGYYEGDTTCDCSVSSENTRHMLECPLLVHSCSLDDLLQFNVTVTVEQWKAAV